MEEGLFPHSRSYVDPTEMEEERRLAYVAYTRAKKQLYLTYTQSRAYFGSINSNPISRFITDLPEHLLELNTPQADRYSTISFNSEREGQIKKPSIALNKGDTVKHAVFGVGVVIDKNDDTVLIEFSGGKKELALEYVQLEKI
jgi:DNA helicase-2/ATP-dependent DNA helicase PcrA